MNNVIDHAIQIPVAPNHVWELISNPENNPKWFTDCQSIAFLNSIRRGIGMRWRYKDKNGREYVTEITAWYEGLGFEYTIVDGVSYTPNKGRIRLQEVAEGTVVQWTFSYELTGLLGGLRNSLGIKRTLDTTIVESLRNLYRLAKDQYKELDVKNSKSLMRDAPNVQERATYQPKHPSVLQEGKPKPTPTPAVSLPSVSNDALYARPAIAEPPLADDDTRPNPAVQTPAIQADATPLPVAPSIAPTPVVAPPIPVAPTLAEIAKPMVEVTPLVKTEDPPPPTTIPPVPAPTIATPTPEPIVPKIDITKLDKRDTATISVFELFGLPKPSETNEINPVPRDSGEKEITKTTETPIVTPTIQATETMETAEPIHGMMTTEVLPMIVTDMHDIETRTTMVEQVLEQRLDAILDTPFMHTPMIKPDVVYRDKRMGLRRIIRQRLVRLRLPKS
jgi:uncharacterized membrane protein